MEGSHYAKGKWDVQSLWPHHEKLLMRTIKCAFKIFQCRGGVRKAHVDGQIDNNNLTFKFSVLEYTRKHKKG